MHLITVSAESCIKLQEILTSKTTKNITQHQSNIQKLFSLTAVLLGNWWLKWPLLRPTSRKNGLQHGGSQLTVPACHDSHASKYAGLCRSNVSLPHLLFSLSKVHLEVNSLCNFELTKPSAAFRWAMFHPSIHWCHWFSFPSTVLPYIRLDQNRIRIVTLFDITIHYIYNICIYCNIYNIYTLYILSACLKHVHTVAYNTRQGTEKINH